MINDDKLIASIRKRDADIGEFIPEHWQAQQDRRNLLRLLDEAYNEIHKYESEH